MCPFKLIRFVSIYFYDAGLPCNFNLLMLFHMPYAGITLNNTVFLPPKYVFLYFYFITSFKSQLFCFKLIPYILICIKYNCFCSFKN